MFQNLVLYFLEVVSCIQNRLSNNWQLQRKDPLLTSHFFLSDTAGGDGGVVCDEPVVDVEGDEEGGEARDGDDVQNSWVVDEEKQAILIFEICIEFWKECVLSNLILKIWGGGDGVMVVDLNPGRE